MFRIIKKILALLGIAILSLVLIGLGFLFFSPQFGGTADDDELQRYKRTGYFYDGQFQNLIETNMEMGLSKIWTIMKEMSKDNPDASPSKELPVTVLSDAELNSTEDALFWFGHSAFLLKIDGANILLDPMLGDVPAPSPLIGNERFNKKLPASIERLPEIDAIVLSHDHYDHLDYGSIMELESKTKRFYVPIGVGKHLKSWGIDQSKIFELTWWEEVGFDSLAFAFTPSRHFSGRGITDRNKSQWGSWIIMSMQKKIFFSGDGGYGPHFKEIGDRYGPFDLALLECGQYNENWADIHMMPEQTAQASIDVRADYMMPIHWGSFKLALHPWNDPIVRLAAVSEELNLNYISPQIGQKIIVGDTSSYQSYTEWWKDY